ncbi:MATE family efflux transporter [Maribacter luteus]|uniref:Oligosaccharide flippase family protein n=1 Tax=Maribacter luteus TaxID=2594478 RepID=A0A6I2MLE3_9FLAO|nr:MATE family efflux transporter [Maribacter luteus]MRX63340.1 oligosaccharide flippase family protein [Maribacter luteus]
MQHAKRVAKNTGILYVQMAITVVLSLYTTRLVLAALGAEDFGIFNVVGGAIAMLTFLNSAMASASQRFMSYATGEGNLDKLKKIFNISFKLHVVIAFILVIVLEIVGYFLFHGILEIETNRIDVAKLIYQFLIVSTFFTVVSVPYDAVINAHENMFLVAVLRIAETMLKLVIAVYITYATGDKLFVYGMLMAALSITLLVFRQVYCHKKYEEVAINFSKYSDKKLFRQMTGFAGWSFLGTSTSMIANYGQTIIINSFFGTKVNAAQGVAVQVSGQLSAFATVMLKALNPVLAKSEGAGNRGLMLKASMLGSKISFFLLMLFFVPVLIEMPYIFDFWLKVVPEYTIVFCTLLLIRKLVEQLFFTLESSIAAVGNIKQFQMYRSILNVFPLIVTYFFYNAGYPPQTIYIIFIGYSILLALITLFYAKRDCGLSISYFMKNVFLRCVLSFGMAFVFSAIPLYFLEQGFTRFISVVVLSFVFFVLTVGLVGLESNERTMFKNIIVSFIKKTKANHG